MRFNSGNGGLICQTGRGLYVTDLHQYAGTYLLEGDQRVRLDGLFWFMNEFNNSLYYSDQAQGNHLFRLDLATERSEQVADWPVYGLTSAGEWLYYINEKDRRLYRRLHDGRLESRIVDDEISSFVIDAELVFYSTDQGIRSCRLDGSDRERISDHVAVHLLARNGKLVFADKKNHYSLTLLESSTGLAKVHEDITPNSLNSDGRYLYCANRSYESTIYRIDDVTGAKIRICGESADYLHIVEDSIYFCKHRLWHRMSLAGGQAVQLFKSQEAEV